MVEFVEDPWISRVPLRLPAPQSLRQRQDVVQFHGAVHEVVRGKDLFQQGRARAREPDDEYGVSVLGADPGSAFEQVFGAGFHLRLRASFVDFGLVSGLGHLEGVAALVVFERLVKLAPVFQRLAGGETQVNAVLCGNPRRLLETPDMTQFLVAETVGLGVGQAPEGIAEIGAVTIGLPIGLDGIVERAHGFLRVTGQQVQLAAGGVRIQDLPVERDPFVEPAESDQGGGEGRPETAVLRLQLQQFHRLFVGFLELCFSDQEVGVVEARLHVIGCEFDAALEQELRIVVYLELRSDLRQQAHGLDVMPMRMQELPAQLLGLVELPFVTQVDDVHQFRRQPLQGFEPFACPPCRLQVPLLRMQLRERAPTGGECRVSFHRPGVCRDGLFKPALRDTDVTALLPCARMPVVLVVQSLQRRQGLPELASKTLRHREQVQRLGTRLVLEAGSEQVAGKRSRLGGPRRLDQSPGLVKRYGGAIGARHPGCAAGRV